MNDANKIDKLITTSIIEDDQYFNENLEDDVNGYDYKEVVDQYPRKWIMNSIPKKDDHEKNIIKTIEDALRRYDEECENFTKKSKTMLVQSKNKNKNNINKKTKENINTFSHNFNLLLDPFNINALELNEDDIHNLELPFVFPLFNSILPLPLPLPLLTTSFTFFEQLFLTFPFFIPHVSEVKS